MDLKEQIILEYLEQDCGYRKLQEKYGISRTAICKWVQIYQEVHSLERTQKQQNHYLRDMDDPHKKRLPKANPTARDLEKKIAALEKQLCIYHHEQTSFSKVSQPGKGFYAF